MLYLLVNNIVYIYTCYLGLGLGIGVCEGLRGCPGEILGRPALGGIGL